MLNREECLKLHKQNAGKVCWLEFLATNDSRILLKNENETLYMFMSAEWDHSEQSQAARLCAAINSERNNFKS